MHQERPVGHVEDLDAGNAAYALDHLVEMSAVGGEDGDVADLGVLLDAHDVDRAQGRAGLADRSREPRERSRRVIEPRPQRRAEGGGGMHARKVGATSAGRLGGNYVRWTWRSAM